MHHPTAVPHVGWTKKGLPYLTEDTYILGTVKHYYSLIILILYTLQCVFAEMYKKISFDSNNYQSHK